VGLRGIFVVALSSVSLVACSLLLDDSFSGGAEDGGSTPDAQSDASTDASVPDADQNKDGPVTPIDAAPDAQVIFREDFETGCGAWIIDDVTLSSVAGHTGMGCRMCTNVASASSIAIEKNLGGPKPGESYQLEVWIKKANTLGPEKYYVSLESEISGGNAKGEVSSAFASDWEKLTVQHTTVPNLQYLVVHVGGSNAVMNDCVDVDEVVVTKK